MAHKKKVAEPEEAELPAFDEAEYMRADVAGTRAAIVAVLWAVPAAVLAFALTVYAGAPVVAFGLGLLLLVLLRRVFPLVGVAVESFKWKDWLGHSGTFFFSWLAFWILLLNPPFADLTPPAIASVTVNGQAVNWATSEVRVNYNNTTETVFVALVSDNAGVVSVTIAVPGENATEMSASGPNEYRHTVPRTYASPVNGICVEARDTAAPAHTARACFDLVPV